jgi:predicted nucleotidyltransferase
MNKNKKLKNGEIKKLKPKITKILKGKGIKRAGIFGSYARGEQKANSDIDILIEFNGSLMSLVALERQLKENLGLNVDLLTYGSIHPLLKNRILNEEIRII